VKPLVLWLTNIQHTFGELQIKRGWVKPATSNFSLTLPPANLFYVEKVYASKTIMNKILANKISRP